MENINEGVGADPEVQEVHGAAAGQAAAGGGRLTWTNVMSGFVLRRFCELVGQGVKTDKGFKEVHLNAVARDLKEFTGLEVTGTQVYNHLCKWRARWVKICRLKELSGSLWDEDNFMISLAPDHYNGHTKDHPKDAEFLNVPLINYTQMQTIFASGVATGRFAMGDNEPLGQPREEDTIDLEAEGFQGGAAAGTSAAANGGAGTSAATNGSAGTSEVKPKTDDEKEPKKRKLSCQDEHLMQGITSAIWGMAQAMIDAASTSAKAEAVPGLYPAVMSCPNFSREALMFALGHLMDNKSVALTFLEMNDADRDLWLRTHLSKHFY
ncbi:hypothetical protein EJB05_46687, partial [Eragrostis curvula]